MVLEWLPSLRLTRPIEFGRVHQYWRIEGTRGDSWIPFNKFKFDNKDETAMITSSLN